MDPIFDLSNGKIGMDLDGGMIMDQDGKMMMAAWPLIPMEMHILSVTPELMKKKTLSN